MNLRKKCAWDCSIIANLKEIYHKSPIDVGSSPVAFKYFFSIFFFDLLVSLSLLLILCTTGYIYLTLACVYVTNTAP